MVDDNVQMPYKVEFFIQPDKIHLIDECFWNNNRYHNTVGSIHGEYFLIDIMNAFGDENVILSLIYNQKFSFIPQ